MEARVTILPSPRFGEKVNAYIDRVFNNPDLPSAALQLLQGYAAILTPSRIAANAIVIEGDDVRISEIFKPESLTLWERIGDSVWESMENPDQQENSPIPLSDLPSATELIEAFSRIELQPEAANYLITQLNLTSNALDQITTQIKAKANPLIQEKVTSQFKFRRRPLSWLARRAWGVTIEQEAKYIDKATNEIVKEITVSEKAIQEAINDIYRRDLRKNASTLETKDLADLILHELARIGFDPTVISIAVDFAISNYYFPGDFRESLPLEEGVN